MGNKAAESSIYNTPEYQKTLSSLDVPYPTLETVAEQIKMHWW